MSTKDDTVRWQDVPEDEIDIEELYGRNDWRAASLDAGEEVLLTMDRFRVVEFPPWDDEDDGKPRPRLEITFQDSEKTFCPGKQVCHMLTPEYGTEVRNWKGKPVVLYVGRWKNGGKSGERINMRVPTAKELQQAGFGERTTKPRQTRRRRQKRST